MKDMMDVLKTLIGMKDFWPQLPFIEIVGRGPIEIPNVGRGDLPKLFAHLGLKRGAEIGVRDGAYSEVICKAMPDLENLICVDPYTEYDAYQKVRLSEQKKFQAEAIAKLTPYNVTFMNMQSEAAAQWIQEVRLPPFDFVYIDGAHDLLNVIRDLCLWTPLVREGGVVAGHDYGRRKPKYDRNFHVVSAMKAYTDSYHIYPWFVLGNKVPAVGEMRDEIRSWMFVKGSHTLDSQK